MCGIAGIIADAHFDCLPTLRPMAKSLQHRGPDDTQFFQSEGVGFVHTRLSIVDIEGGAQPFHSADGRYVLIANGEIYNHVELREDLLRRGCQFASLSDCETALQAFFLEGIDCVHKLRGMFAIAIYDTRQRSLWLVRDRVGIKPLYFATAPSLRAPLRFAFASEIKTLLPLLRNEVRFEPNALRQALEHNYSSGRNCAVAGIQRVLPGEYMHIDSAGERSVRYWSLTKSNLDITTLDEAVEELDFKFNAVVKEHLRSDVPIAAFLSGGLDSSTMLTTMFRHTVEPIETFTLGFDVQGGELPSEAETTIAAETAGRLGVGHHISRISEQDMLQTLPLSVWAGDELMFDHASLPTLALARAAAATHKVVFTGEGGDEVFAGYGRYRVRHLQQIARTLRALSRRALPLGWSTTAPRIFTSEFTRSSEDAPDLAVRLEQGGDRDEDLRQAQIRDIENWLPNDLLVKADRMLMAYGVEGRVPYLDHRLVEFGVSLPARFKIEGRRGKVLQRAWASQRLGLEHLAHLRKQGFTTPARQWLQSESLRWLPKALAKNKAIQSICKKDAIEQLFCDLGRRRHVQRLLWALTSFALWQQIFIERNGERPQSGQSLQDWLDG